MRRLRWILLLLVVVAVVTFVAWPRGVKAVIRNTGTTAMHDVHVVVTGRSYSIGDLAPSQSRATRVQPTSESHIVLTYADGQGGAHLLTVDCYIESRHYSGSITVDVADGAVAKVDDQIRLTMW